MSVTVTTPTRIGAAIGLHSELIARTLTRLGIEPLYESKIGKGKLRAYEESVINARMEDIKADAMKQRSEAQHRRTQGRKLGLKRAREKLAQDKELLTRLERKLDAVLKAFGIPAE